jgi:hypothetical protein
VHPKAARAGLPAALVLGPQAKVREAQVEPGVGVRAVMVMMIMMMVMMMMGVGRVDESDGEGPYC